MRKVTINGGLLWLLLMVSGCTVSYQISMPSVPMSQAVGGKYVKEKQILPPDAAAVSLGHSAPKIISVLEDYYKNAVEQYVYLETSAFSPGESYVRLHFFGHSNQRIFKELDNPALTEALIQKDIADAFPRFGMTVSNLFVRNQYGPFGYAIGQGAGRDLCIYAWQSIDEHLYRRQGLLSVLSGRDNIAIRLRHCSPDASEQELVQIMKQLHVFLGGAARMTTAY